MSRVLRKYQFVVGNFSKLPKEIQVLLTDKQISDDLLKCICEMSYNILKQNVHVSKKEKNRLFKYKNVLKVMCNKKCQKNKKKKILKQVGRGFLPVLFSVISPIIQSLLS